MPLVLAGSFHSWETDISANDSVQLGDHLWSLVAMNCRYHVTRQVMLNTLLRALSKW